MGYGSDEAFDNWLRSTENARDTPPRTWQAGSGDFKWRTKEGVVLDMREMADSHLQNCLRMCERDGNTGKAKQLRTVLKERAQ